MAFFIGYEYSKMVNGRVVIELSLCAIRSGYETIHYAVAKIFGPLIFGRGWCGFACWTAMVLDFLPYKEPKEPRKKLGWM